jgi:hypothetical protein
MLEKKSYLKDETLIDTIKKQNTIDARNEDLCIKIIKRMAKDRSGGSLILEVDIRTHELMLEKERINIGWNKCRVFDHYSIKRCFKCWGFYHIAKDCKRQETCSKCAANHKASECKAIKMRCVSCMHKNKTYNLKINEEHDALSRKCPTFIRALEEEKKRTGWVATK